MVRALLNGSKTQTRRVIKPQPIDARKPETACPHGTRGELLWVRERWAYQRQFIDPRAIPGGPIIYSADCPGLRGPWRSSRCMPRAVSRITLAIIAATPQRLREITPSDCLAEGCVPTSADPKKSFRSLWQSLYAQTPFAWRANPWVWIIVFRIQSVTGSIPAASAF